MKMSFILVQEFISGSLKLILLITGKNQIFM